MSAVLFSSFKSKRKRGEPQGKWAFWFSGQESFAFTSALTLGECVERLNEAHVIEQLKAANSGLHPNAQRAYSASLTQDSADELSFSIVEKWPFRNSGKPTNIHFTIEGQIRTIDSQSVFTEGEINFFETSGCWVLLLPIMLFLMIVTDSISRWGIGTIGACFLLFALPLSLILYKEYSTNNQIKTTRLALIRDMLEAKQKFSREEQAEPADGNSPGSTESSASL